MKEGIPKTSELSPQILNAIRASSLSTFYLSNTLYRKVGMICQSCYSLPFSSLPFKFFFNSIISTSTVFPRVEIKVSQWELGFQLNNIFTKNEQSLQNISQEKVIPKIYGSTIPWDSKWHLCAWKEQCFRFWDFNSHLLSAPFWKGFTSLCEASVVKWTLLLTTKKKANVLTIGDLTQQTNSC